MPARLAMVKDINEDDACARLQTGSIARGLVGSPDFECDVYKPSDPGDPVPRFRTVL